MAGCRDPGPDSGALQQDPFAAAGAGFGAAAILSTGYQDVQGAPPPSAGYQGFAYQGIANSVGAAGLATGAATQEPLFSSAGPLATSPAKQGGGGEGGFPPAAVPAPNSAPIAFASQGTVISSLLRSTPLSSCLVAPSRLCSDACPPHDAHLLLGMRGFRSLCCRWLGCRGPCTAELRGPPEVCRSLRSQGAASLTSLAVLPN